MNLSSMNSLGKKCIISQKYSRNILLWLCRAFRSIRVRRHGFRWRLLFLFPARLITLDLQFNRAVKVKSSFVQFRRNRIRNLINQTLLLLAAENRLTLLQSLISNQNSGHAYCHIILQTKEVVNKNRTPCSIPNMINMRVHNHPFSGEYVGSFGAVNKLRQIGSTHLEMNGIYSHFIPGYFISLD